MIDVRCPNKSWPSYKQTAEKHSEDYAFQAWILSGYEGFSSVEEAEQIVNQQNAIDGVTVEKIKTELVRVLTIQRKIYEKRPGGSKYLLEIDEVLSDLKSNNNIAGLIKMLEFSKANVTQVMSRLSAIKTQYGTDFSSLSQDELIKVAETMQEIKRFVSTYNILEEVEQLSIFADVSSQDSRELSTMLRNFRGIVRNYKEMHEELLATWLSNQAERVNEGLRTQNKMELLLTKARIKALLNTAISDISSMEKMFGAQANSKDPLTGLIASSIKEEAYKVHLENVARKERLVSLYRKAGGSNNPAEFNAKYMMDVDNYEFVPERDKQGNLLYDDKGRVKGSKKYVKRKAFITEFREDQFWKDFRTFNNSLDFTNTGPEEVLKRIRARNKWLSENTVRITDPQSLIAEKRKVLTPLEFDRWIADNTERIPIKYYANGSNMSYYPQDKIHEVSKDGKTFVIYKEISDFYRPSDKYKNKDYAKLANDEYYQELYNAYKDANNKVHHRKRLKYGIIPQRRGTGYDKYITGNSESLLQNLKDDFGHSVNIETYDTTYGLQTPDKKELKHIPIYFTELLPEHELSKDLLESTLAYSQMANNYNSMSKIEPFIEMVYDAVEGNEVVDIKARDVQIMNAKGVVKTEPMTGTPLSSRTKRVNEALIEFLDKVVYGEYEIPSVFTIGDKEFSKNKIAKNLVAFSSLNGLAFNINSFFNNTLLGNFTMAIESFAGQYFTKKDFIAAEGTYMTNFPTLLNDVTTGYPKSKLGRLMMVYDVMQGNFEDTYGNNVSGNTAKRLMTTDSLYFLSHSAEHQIQGTGFIAMAKKQQVKYQDGSTSSLWDAYDEKGALKKGAIWTQKDQFAFVQKLHALNKGMHGIYNKFDSPTLKRRWYGKLALLFRNWIYSGIQRRYSSEFVNIESGVVEEGYYRKFFIQLYKELSVGKTDMLFGNNLTPEQKAARARSLAEVTTMVLVFATYAALSGDDDDEPNSWLQTQLILQTRRLGGDFLFYTPINIAEPLRILRNPSASITVLEKTQKFIFQLVDPFEQYEQKSGYYHKGDYKIEKRFNDLVPIYNQIIRFMTPEQQLQEYTGRNK